MLGESNSGYLLSGLGFIFVGITSNLYCSGMGDLVIGYLMDGNLFGVSGVNPETPLCKLVGKEGGVSGTMFRLHSLLTPELPPTSTPCFAISLNASVGSDASADGWVVHAEPKPWLLGCGRIFARLMAHSSIPMTRKKACRT